MRTMAIYDLTAADRPADTATYAVVLTGLVLIAGVGFDYGRLAAKDSNLQSGADQATLAGATQLKGVRGACLRASVAAIGIVTTTILVFNNDNTVSSASDPTCDVIGSIRFSQNRNRTKQYG